MVAWCSHVYLAHWKAALSNHRSESNLQVENPLFDFNRRNIRDNVYSFPSNVTVNEDAKDIITAFLNPKPDDRPSIDDVMEHPYFDRTTMPRYIPLSALEGIPQFNLLAEKANVAPVAALKELPLQNHAGWTSPTSRTNVAPVAALKELPLQNHAGWTSPTRLPRTNGKTRTGPSSSSSSSSSSAATATMPVRSVGKEPLMAFQQKSSSGGDQRMDQENSPSNANRYQSPESHFGKPELSPHPKVSPSSAAQIQNSPSSPLYHRVSNLSLKSTHSPSPLSKSVVESPEKPLPALMKLESPPPPPPQSSLSRVPRRATSFDSPLKLRSPLSVDELGRSNVVRNFSPPPVLVPPTSVLQRIFTTLTLGLDQYHQGILVSKKRSEPIAPTVFITKWIDYTNKYGLSYQLRDGSVGVYFNDGTSIILATDAK